jgi:ATP-binding cassette subfamily B protein
MTKKRFTPFRKLYGLALAAIGEKKTSYIKSVRWFIVACIAQGIAFGMFYPLMKSIFAETPDTRKTLMLFGIMTVVTAVSLIAKWIGHDFDFTGNIVDIAHDMRTRLGVNLRRMPLERLSTYKTGELNAIFANNVEESGMSLGIITAMIVELIFVPLTIVVVTFFVDWRLALIMVVLFPLAIPLYDKIRNTNVTEMSAFNRANAELEAGFIEYIQGLPVLRAVNRTGVNEEKLQDSIKKVRSAQISGLYRTQFPFFLMGLLIQAVLLLLLFFGAWFVLEDTLALVTLGACIIVVARLVEPLSLFVAVIYVFEMTDVALGRINEVLEIEPLTIHKPAEEPVGHDIRFDGVDFTYLGQSEKTIRNVSFHMPERTMTAIVGHSGCGKTTLTKLLMRFADVQQGSIRIGGADIRHMTQEELMSHISMVFQDVYLFDDTVMNNIRMNSPNATDEEVGLAVRAAHCHEFIDKLPEGYETAIGDIGGSLSGGERQRISIARAILKDAPIVILDEPTAALDTESEVSVQQAIDELLENRTVIVIAHRLSTIVGADRILVMDGGEIIEQGRHHELMALKGKYHDMWAAQQRVKAWSVVEE